jgi:hypothetical protein
VLASRRLFSSGDHNDDTPPVALELKSYTKSQDWKNYSPESGDSSGGATEPYHNIQGSKAKEEKKKKRMSVALEV